MRKFVKNSERKEFLIGVIKYLFYFFLFYIMSKANINGYIYPFSFGILFALMWCNNKVLILAPLYILASFLGTFDPFSLYSAIATSAVMLITYGIHFKFKIRMKYWQIGIYALVSQACFVCLSIFKGAGIISVVLSIVLGILFMAACIKIFEAITLKGFAYKLTVDEIICAGIVLIGFSNGLSEFSFGSFELIKLFATFMILSITYAFNISTALFASGIAGFGSMLNTNSPIYIAAFIIWAMAVSCFKIRNKYLSVIALLLIEAALGWFFGLYYSYNIFAYLPCLIGSLIFLIIPHKYLDEISGFFMSNVNNAAMRNVANRNSENLGRKLGELSDIFGEIDTSFRGMIKGGLSIEQAREMLANDIRDKICYDCPEKNKCHRQFEDETKKVLNNIIDSSLERGKATLIDVPPYLTSRCNRVNIIISSVNEMSEQYRKYAGLMKNFDSSRILVAEQMGGISKIMRSLSQEINQPLTFDTWKENKIIEELSFSDIICSDVVVYEKEKACSMVTLVVKNEDSKNEKISDVISKICGNKMVLERESSSGRSGWTVLNFKLSPVYNIVFGTAATKKATSKISGDSYSLIKIDNDKFMMAVCDGMGSGNRAEKSSNLAIGLIENFYKAGFDNEIILSSTNKLLALSGEEIFSALDIAVIDLRKGIADVIKLGAPIGLIKHKSSINILEGNSLPMGIIDETQTNIKKLVLSNGDFIILATDGITDSFYSNEDYANFVNNLTESNPQMLAEKILKQALQNCGGSAVDDMTIIVSKIFKI